ncbi:MAG: extracellular solute-binding protein [Candidatus Sungbacteria bacterium]|uniref:Extracellular solute-binding protein n=1 Tax=Candidatus Sungiibacteriota bacterium TaxID=2750080 RepID=A0A9D6QVK2_9BACT|nr:extracellular solute-binding protein [Candidatus Sungbacteria bacterium]
MLKNLKSKIIAFAVAGFVILLAMLILTGVISPFKAKPVSGQVTVWVPPQYKSAMAPIVTSFQSQYPAVKVTLEEKNETTYETDLINALASGAGPDVILLPSSDIGLWQNKLLPAPRTNVLTLDQFESQAPDAAIADLVTQKGEMLGLPLSVDTLALYYNKDLFNAANIISPPQTWDDFAAASGLMVARLINGDLTQSGASIGTAQNVNHFFEILSELILQTGNPIATLDGHVTLADKTGDSYPALSALNFYTSFADPSNKNYSWTNAGPNSLEAFAQGQAGMYFGYAADLETIITKNPHLNFSVAPFPQLAKGSRKSFARYPVLAVTRASTNPTIAWAFISNFYTAANQKILIDALGLPPARRDLIHSLPPNKILRPFYDQVLSGQSWPIPDYGRAQSIFRTMIESAVSGGSIGSADAISRAAGQLKLLLNPNGQ